MRTSPCTGRHALPLAGVWGVLLLLAFVYGCAGSGRAPVSSPGASPRTADSSQQRAREQREIPASGQHIVNRGDTLYGVAWRYGLDYRNVARWNNISQPYTIYPGDRIRLRPPTGRSVAAAAKATQGSPSPPLSRSSDSKKPSPPLPRAEAKQQPEQRRQAAAKPAGRDKQVAADGPVQWSWPTRGELVRAKSPTGEKGIKISGRLKQPIAAAAAGRVVYSGSGLIGYGKLIIIKHNATYLSAYAHNNELLVKEGDSVKGGQQIATMGAASDGAAALHFEIRRDGQPIDPLQHLPDRQG